MTKINLKANATQMVLFVIGLIFLITFLLSGKRPHRLDMSTSGSGEMGNVNERLDTLFAQMRDVKDLVKEVNKITKEQMRSSDDILVAPTMPLAYNIDSPRGWARRLAFRNHQASRSNKVAFGSENPSLKTFFQERWEPTFSCNFPTRIGRIGDGGKWVCNPEDMLKVANEEGRKVLIYSLGSNSEYSFEEGLRETFGDKSEIHTFDMGKPIITPPSFINFHQWKMVGIKEDGLVEPKKAVVGKSLNSIRETLGHVGKTIDILKVDIEGSEYSVLNSYMTKEDGCLLNASMLLMETHWDTTHHYNELFQKLSDICGMELYMKEPNIQYSDGAVLEWCFVKVDWTKIPKTH